MDLLSFLYHTVPGRILLKPLTLRPLSEISGKLMDLRISVLLIPFFEKANHIDLSDYEIDRWSGYRSFNDFFSRKIKRGKRPVDPDPEHLIAPCDGLLSVWNMKDDTVLSIKQSRFTLKDLLLDERLSDRYKDGICLVFRLCVSHYHRYCYADSGKKTSNRRILGKYHTVRPVALRSVPVFTENTREYTVIQSEQFGRITQMEVGALLVGRIVNYMEEGLAERGEEKGMFQYGGSTILLLLEKGVVSVLPEYVKASAEGEELPVKMGQWIGTARS